MKLFKFGALSIIILIVINACSTSENALSEVVPETSSVFPTWYQPAEVVSDSLSYTGFATAIAADSLKAIERADKQARIYLERKIAQLTEDIRTDMKKSGSVNVDNTDFIIILRTAHFGVEEAANSVQSLSRKTEGYYRGFSSVSISRKEINSVLEKGFTGHPRYWGEFSSSPSFSMYF